MSNCNNVNFHGVQKIGDSNLLDQLEDNLKSYLDNGFLHIGGWINARRAADAEPYKLTESYINYADSINSIYSAIFNDIEPLTEFLQTVDLDKDFRTALLINFDPNLGNLAYDGRLRVVASGTHNGSTLNMLDTGFITDKNIFNLIAPTGYDKLLLYIDPSDRPVYVAGIGSSTGGKSDDYGDTDVKEHILPVPFAETEYNFYYNANSSQVLADPTGVVGEATSDTFLVEFGGTRFVDTGSVTGRGVVSFLKPEGITELLVTISGLAPTRWSYNLMPSNPYVDVPIAIQVSSLDLPTNLYDTVSTPVESKEYTLFFDAYGGGKVIDDAKNLILTANSGNSSVLLIDTGYVSGTTKSSLPCIPTGVSENTESYTFTKPSGYDSITIDYSQHNKYDNSFYYKIEYTDTYNPPASLYGDFPYQLKPTEVNGYKIGQVWQAFKKDWVWETGIEYYPDPKYCDNFSPINISGIYVNNNFLPGPTGVANSGYHINYPLGQIIFDKAIPKTSKVELNYSYRWCQVYKSSSDSSWKELQELTYSPNPSLNQPSAGDYSISANHRIQMPCIIIEPSSRTSSKPYQLGDYSQYQSQDFLLHVFTENSVDKNRICDIIRLQKDQIISLYDINKVVNFGVQPLNYDGSVNPNGLSYTELLSNYCWNKTMFKDFGFIDMESKNKNLYWCIIRLTSETIT